MTDPRRATLDGLLDEARRLLETVRSEDGTIHPRAHIPDQEALHRWVAISAQLIEHIAGQNSSFRHDFRRVARDYPQSGDLSRATGVLQAFVNAWDTGLLRSRELLISAELFEDALELGEYLLSKEYKDPAAVVVGAVLESALRKMCQLRNIPLGGRETLEPLNVALAKHDPPPYNAPMSKQITAWGSIRNDAAHGRWDQYDAQQVELMLQGVRNFIATQLS
jgi:hypothetical protein